MLKCKLEHPMLHQIVSGLTRHGAPPSPIFLETWMDTLSPSSNSRLLAIRSLVKQAGPSAREYVEAGIKNPTALTEEFLVGLWRTRFTLEELTPIWGSPLQAEGIPFNSLPDFLQDLQFIQTVDSMIKQSGLDVFFTDSLGKFPNKTIKALGRIGAKKHQMIFSELVKLYGKGPHGDQGEVLDYMETLSERTQDKMEVLEEKLGDLPGLELIHLKWDWKRQGGK